MDSNKSINISIIMPSLNVVDYIGKCIQSVQEQNLEGIEILCIDAGSTDGTVDIIQNFASVDERIRIIHSDKKSYGYQVNIGIKEAKGKYIDIVETDDSVCPNVLKTMFDASEQYDLDICRCNYYLSEHIGKKNVLTPRTPLKDAGYGDMYGKVICVSDYPKLLISDWTIWDGIIRRQFILDNNIYCNESNGAAYQDLGFSVEMYAAPGKTMYLDNYYYRYTFDRAESSIRQNKSYIQVAGEYKRLFYDNVISKNEFAKIRKIVDCKMLNTYVYQAEKILPMVKYDIDSELFKEPYNWFKNQIELEFNGDFSDNICEVSPEIISRVKELSLSPKSYANELHIENERVQNERKTLFETILSNGGHIVIFGCGIRGKNLLQWISSTCNSEGKMIFVDIMTDNNYKLWNSSPYGINIVSPKEAAQNYCGDTFVIANKFHYEDIKKQLLDLGIAEKFIFNFK